MEIEIHDLSDIQEGDTVFMGGNIPCFVEEITEHGVWAQEDGFPNAEIFLTLKDLYKHLIRDENS